MHRFLRPGPPNFGMSIQDLQSPQSSRIHPVHSHQGLLIPYVEVKVEESDETASHSPSSQHTLPGHFHGNFAGDEQHLAGANGNYSQTLLYVHQEGYI